MSKALSGDLRIRVLDAVEAGASNRQAAGRFGVSAASVSRWCALAGKTGDIRPGTLGGDRRSGRVEAQGVLIRAILEDLWAAIGTIVDTFTPGECANDFSASGHDPDP